MLLSLVSPTLSARADDAAPAAPAASNPHPATLSEDDQEALAKGEIPIPRYVAGGVVGTAIVGFGVGQAIQGRYRDTGWIFTTTEAASVVVLAIGVAQSTFSCADNTSPYQFVPTCNANIAPLFWVGLASLVGFRIWEIVDLWVGPPRQNRAYRRAKAKSGSLGYDDSWTPFVAPTNSNSMAMGLQYHF